MFQKYFSLNINFKVSILLVVLMFIFAVYGVQIIGGQLARCNDRNYYNQQVC